MQKYLLLISSFFFLYACKNTQVINSSSNVAQQSESSQFYSGSEEMVTSTADLIESNLDTIPTESTEPVSAVESSEMVEHENYQAIIDAYREAINQGQEFGTNKDLNYLALYNLKYTGPISYAYDDVDHNGVVELLIKNDYQVFDVFTYNNNTPVKLFNDHTLAERSHMTIYQDGTIVVRGSSGAASGGYNFFEFNDAGSQLNLVAQYFYDFRPAEDQSTLPFVSVDDDSLRYTEEEFYEMTGINTNAELDLENLTWTLIQ